MQIAGRRIHIAGSAAASTPSDLLEYSHTLIASLVRSLATQGATFVIGVGGEPRSDDADPLSPATIFDWTVLATIVECLTNGSASPTGGEGKLVATVGTHKTDQQIPVERRPIWERLSVAEAVHVQYLDQGHVSGAVRRIRQEQMGDVLIALSGGEGVEHLIQLYVGAGKPVIPLDLNLGSSMNDGSGGASRRFAAARSDPGRYLRFVDPAGAALKISRTSTNAGSTDVQVVVDAVLEILKALEAPTAFYVRLLNTAHADYPGVERFFRDVVDPLVTRLGYRPVEMGRGPTSHAWINEAIFDNLHYSSVVVADVTGGRPNCYMELGYALGHAQRVILTAMQGTRLEFDGSMLDCHLWDDSLLDPQRLAALEEYWRRNIVRPPLVKERAAL